MDPFQFDQLPLEWCARRAVSGHFRRSRALAIRSATGGVMTAMLEDDAEPSDEFVTHVLRFMRAAGRGDSAATPPSEWRAFELDGEQMEWRTEPVESMLVGLAVELTVRNPANGRSIGMQLRAARRPTVEDAIVAATLSERTLRDDVDEEIDLAVGKLGEPRKPT